MGCQALKELPYQIIRHQLGHTFALKKKGIDPEIILAPGCLTGLQGIKGTEKQIKGHYKAASVPVQNVGHPAR